MSKPIKLHFKIMGGTNSIIPTGVKEDLIVFVRDGSAAFRFNNASITRELARKQKIDKIDSRYVERIQSTIVKYPKMTQKQIVEHITEKINEARKPHGTG